MESLSFNGLKCKLLNYILNGNYNTITFIYIIMLYSNFYFHAKTYYPSIPLLY